LLTIGAAGMLVLLVAVVPATSAHAASSPSVQHTPFGALLAKLHDPAATANDYFGLSVAEWGKTAVVGAFDTSSYAGAAYFYVKGVSGWPKKPGMSVMDPAAISDDFFGNSVAVSDTTAIVSDPGTSGEVGTVYIYVKGASGWSNKPTVTLTDPASAMFDNFGNSVAVSGNTAVVGAWGARSRAGAAYIYKA
jgi:hypothetical protein